jgi:hypothetical protein
MTVSKRFMEKLEAARDALSHSHPGADMEAILEAGLDLVVERAAKRRGLVKIPRKQSPLTSSPSSAAAAAESASACEGRNDDSEAGACDRAEKSIGRDARRGNKEGASW